MLATYGDDFYAGHPALTVNAAGRGFVYYQAARSGQGLRTALLAALRRRHGVRPLLPLGSLPPGVTLQRRVAADGREFWFFLNFRRDAQTALLHDRTGHDLLFGNPLFRRNHPRALRSNRFLSSVSPLFLRGKFL